MLDARVYAELDARLAPVDAALERDLPGERPGRQPVHTVYVPADRYHADLVAEWGEQALSAVDSHPPLPFPAALRERVLGKLRREPIEDLRVDFEDGYGIRTDSEEDAAARAVAGALRSGPLPPFVGVRVKSLVAPTRRRALRTLDVLLDALGPLPPGFVLTLPKVYGPEPVAAFTVVCGQLEAA